MRKLFVGLVLSLSACAATAKQVEVKGGNEDLVKLAGNWEGQYEGLDSGRTGAIKFNLEVGRHTADGEVFLGGNTPLKITFVQVEGGQVNGRIDPYTDPTCNCMVRTEFEGLFRGDSVDGTFTTKVLPDGKELRGNWQVARKGS